MLAVVPRAAVPPPFLPESEGGGGGDRAHPTLARLAARASLPTPRLVCLGPPPDEEGDDAGMDAEAGTAGLHPSTSPTQPGLAVSPGAAHAAHATLAGASVGVALAGRISNASEVAALYGSELSSDGEDAAGVDLFLDAFMRGWADESGDGSDQPATFLASLHGSWAAVVVARGEGGGGSGSVGGGGCHLIVARGRGAAPPERARASEGPPGGDDDDEEEGDDDDDDGDDDNDSGGGPPPLFWGVVDGAVVVATTPALSPGEAGGSAAALAPFPAGCVYESGRPGNPAPSLADFTRPSPRARTVTPLSKRDSRGRLCGLAYTSKSGRDLVAAAAGGGGCGSESMVE